MFNYVLCADFSNPQFSPRSNGSLHGTSSVEAPEIPGDRPQDLVDLEE